MRTSPYLAFVQSLSDRRVGSPGVLDRAVRVRLAIETRIYFCVNTLDRLLCYTLFALFVRTHNLDDPHDALSKRTLTSVVNMLHLVAGARDSSLRLRAPGRVSLSTSRRRLEATAVSFMSSSIALR